MGKTGYFSHRDCWLHEMGPGHPECPGRLDAIEDRLLVTGVADALERCPDIALQIARPARYLKVHRLFLETIQTCIPHGTPASVSASTAPRASGSSGATTA